MQIEQVKQLLDPYLQQEGLSLYSIDFVKEAGALILRVCIDKVGGVDIDTLAACNEYLSQQLDQIDADMEEYFLEVSSPGAEQELRNLDEVRAHIGAYVRIELPHMVYEGNLLDLVEENLQIRFNAKGRFKTIQIPYKEIKFIRLAVKV